ncbi:MAG: ATP-binding protein [Bacteroidales bacterium]|nr:ATP-binding protein [Bacteroidales bacterium]
MEEKSRFKIQLDRVLEVLCSQIYDSPLSLLRENVQNAYDAILMRQYVDKSDSFNPLITITIETTHLSISDNGIGMNSESLKKHFWTAGSSGKNNNEARAAGVIGTFGIGAMANFGVCSELKVVSRAYGEEMTYTSSVKKAELSIEEDCINTVDYLEQRDDYGTTVTAYLATGFQLSFQDAKNYLTPYVKYLPVPVLMNGECLSQVPITLTDGGDKSEIIKGAVNEPGISFDYQLTFNTHSNVTPQIMIENIVLNNELQEGFLCLKSSEPSLYGMRNYFGLAPVPVSSAFNFGGVVNLSSLIPTAGREAVSRFSINTVSMIVRKADEVVAKAIAANDVADQSRELIVYIKNNHFYSLANNIRITVCGSDERMKLGDVAPIINGKKVSYYEGRDKQIQSNHSDENQILLLPADDNNRRQVQIAVLKMKGIKPIPDTIDIKPISMSELTIPEISIATKIKTVMADDYLMNDANVRFAKISHNLASTVQKEEDKVAVYLSRKSPDISYLCDVYNNSYALFEPMIKDYVRTKLYTKFSQYVPSSTRDGAEALYNILQRKRELYTIEYSELGEMESVMKDYLDGKIPYRDVLKAAATIKNKQTQTLTTNQVGDISEVMSGGNTTGVIAPHKEENSVGVTLDALPPIIRLDIDTKFKVLHTDDKQHVLSGYNTFLAVSDRMFREYYEFFLQPHTTRIIWSMHKIIYIFTHVSSNLTLYYDIDLMKKLDRDATGGRMIPTATIITKDRIFIPVIPEMDDYFNIKDGQLKFSVRFDSVTQ